MPNKDETFRRTFQTGLGIGASNFQLRERERIDIEKQQAKDREKRRIENQKQDALSRALGVDMGDPAQFDPLTKQPVRKSGQVTQGEITEGVPSTIDTQFDVGTTPVEQQEEEPLVRPSPLEVALTKQTLSPEGRQIYGEFLKETFPSISDEYFGVKEMKHPDKEGGGLYGFDKETGERKLIRELPNYKPKPITGGSYIVYGTADLQGETIGIKGRRSRVVELDDGTFKISDLGVIPSGAKSDSAEKELLEFQISMADFQNTADALANRRQQYLTKDFSDIGGEASREDYRVGYNSSMNELALRTANLGSDEAKAESIRIWNEGLNIVGGQDGGKIRTNIARSDYFDIMRDEVLANINPSNVTGDGKWSYQDAQSIIKFLEYKYENYLPRADTEADEDLLGSYEMDDEGNIVEKGNK